MRPLSLNVATCTLSLAMLSTCNRCTNAFKITSRSYFNAQRLLSASKTRTYTSSTLFVKSKSISTEVTEEGIKWQSRKKCWRPTVQDVENISWGKPAKKKGTGSRGVPHRLNHDEERKLFDQARKKGFLEVTGSGWRSQRRDAPLLNTYRSLCDARGQVCIVLHKSNTGTDDELVIDLSPLRLPDTFVTLGEKIVSYLDIPVESTNFNLDVEGESNGESNENEIEREESDDDDDDGEKEDVEIVREDFAWEERPIYQLNPYCISWKLDRSEGKTIGKKLATIFKTIESNASKSKKPNHIKPGKNRRSGGYGIG